MRHRQAGNLLTYTGKIHTTLNELVEDFRAAGYQLWMVGGAVRDELLGLEPHDLDFATDATPDQMHELFMESCFIHHDVGEKFGTVSVYLEDKSAYAELTTFRGTEVYLVDSRHPAVTFTDNIYDDLARRDFTINAIAKDMLNPGVYVDPFHGGMDIKARVVRAVGNAEERFTEDPLRILRGIRIAAQLGLTINGTTIKAMSNSRARLSSLSQERVTDELNKIILAPFRHAALTRMLDMGILEDVLPEVVPMVGCEQNSYHVWDVWGHACAALEWMKSETLTLKWAALLHDIGKPSIRHRKPDGEWGFFGHEVVGALITEKLLTRLKFSNQDIHDISLLVRMHMDKPNPKSSKSVRRFIRKSEGLWKELILLKRADNSAGHTYKNTEYIDELEAACKRSEEEEPEKIAAKSPLSGDDLLALFSKDPGPWIRPIKEELSRMVLDGELEPGDKNGALEVARRMVNA